MNSIKRFITSVGIASLAQVIVEAGPVEHVVNGGFETGDFTAWDANVTGGAFRPWNVSGMGAGGGFGMLQTNPAGGNFVAWNGFDGGGPLDFTLDQTVSIPALQDAILSWKYRVQWNFTLGGQATEPRIFSVQILDAGNDSVLSTVFTFSTETQAVNPTGNTDWQSQSVDISQFAGTTIKVRFLAFIPQSATGPGQLELDDISLISDVLDSDGDGIPDSEDACVLSDLSPTVVIDGCDSGVDNLLFEDGCTISDLIHACSGEVSNHGEFVRCVAHLSNDLSKADIISNKDKGRIQKCAAQSSIGQYQ